MKPQWMKDFEALTKKPPRDKKMIDIEYEKEMKRIKDKHKEIK